MKVVSTPQGSQLTEAQEVGDVHRHILRHAADLANNSPNLPLIFRERGIRPLREANYLTGNDVLTLAVVEGAYAGLEPEVREEAQHQLHRLAVQSIKQALIDNKELLVGLVVGEARKGTDYFERYRQVTDIG